MTQDKENTLCCAQCGNIHVQMKAWVDINTNEYISSAAEDEYDFWCDECDDHTVICTVAEFERNNPMSNCN